MRTPSKDIGETKPWRLLLWTAVAGLLFGMLGLGLIAEDALRTARNSLHAQKASGDIALVKIDDQSLRQVGRWPWPRRVHAELINSLTAAGAKRIFFDFDFVGESDSADDRLLAEAMERSGKVILPVRMRDGTTGEQPGRFGSADRFQRHAGAGTITASYNYHNAVWRLPYARGDAADPLPSYAALLANVKGPAEALFTLDYSVDPQSVPAASAATLLSDPTAAAAFRGKDVVIGQTSDVLRDIYFIPGTGQMGGAYVQIIGAETLKQGRPWELGWMPLYLLALAVSALTLLNARGKSQLLLLASAFAVVLAAPIALDAKLIFLDVTPALFVMLIVASCLGWRRYRQQGLVNATSGLPNLTALRLHPKGRERALVAARILNYAEIVATLPASSERQLVEQIVSRLSVGAPNRLHYHGDGGIFAWFEDPKMPFGHHLEALYALFRNPVRVAGLSMDLSISFGVEIGSGRSLANRLGSALVAAEEAAHDGLKWKYFDPDALQDASWKLSMLSQLDEAIDRNEVWVAYQPKIDLKTRQIIGAEALARWTHPEKGPISASEFIAAAEQHDRIGKLTSFVLEEAIAAAAALNRGAAAFDMSVNLSGRLLADRGLVGRVAIALEKHGLAPHHLTLELTETAALAGIGDAIEMLGQLRQLGVNISIDDYGTGLSTLEYLKRIPAGEIKIDQTFIKGMTENRSERLMVQSTIALAHSLGRTVVAEGVETRETLELLAEMECDIAQGFIIGRPMSLDSIRRRLSSDRGSKVA